MDCKTGTLSKEEWELTHVEINRLMFNQPNLVGYYGDVRGYEEGREREGQICFLTCKVRNQVYQRKIKIIF